MTAATDAAAAAAGPSADSKLVGTSQVMTEAPAVAEAPAAAQGAAAEAVQPELKADNAAVPTAAAPAPAAEAKEVCLSLPPCAAAAQSAHGIRIAPLAVMCSACGAWSCCQLALSLFALVCSAPSCRRGGQGARACRSCHQGCRS